MRQVPVRCVRAVLLEQRASPRGVHDVLAKLNEVVRSTEDRGEEARSSPWGIPIGDGTDSALFDKSVDSTKGHVVVSKGGLKVPRQDLVTTCLVRPQRDHKRVIGKRRR